MRVSLGLKLMLTNLFVICFGMLVVWLAMDILTADFTTQLMSEFNVLPARMHWLFLSTVHRYLMWSALAAVGIAALFSFLMTRHVLRPLRDMRSVAERVAKGDYSCRTTSATRDEIGQLADDLNRMAESLQRIEALRKDMVTDVAHELRTPLTNMRGYIEGLVDGVVTADKENFELLQEECLRLAKLVDNLLQLAEVDAASLTFSPTMVDLLKMIEDTSHLVHSRLEAKHLSLDIRIEEAVHHIRADHDKLTQILINLIENAVCYASPEGSIVIAAKQESQGIRITFTNDVDSDPDTDFTMVFERFYRGEKSRSRQYGGAGIGLSIVKELVNLHGGEVGASADTEHVSVWFTLPA